MSTKRSSNQEEMASSAKKEKLMDDTDDEFQKMNVFENSNDFNKDNPDVLNILVKTMVHKCGGKITKDFLILREVNIAWREAVDWYLRTTKKLTIEVTLEEPEMYNKDEDFQCLVRFLEKEDTAEKFMHVNDVAADFTRLCELDKKVLAAYELKGPLVTVDCKQVPAFIAFIKGLLFAGGADQPCTMKQTMLSLAIIDKHKDFRFAFKSSFSQINKETITSLINLETFFPDLEHFFLTVSIDPGSHGRFSSKLLESIAINRQNGRLKTLDLNLIGRSFGFKGNPLNELAPQLEHLGLNYEVKNQSLNTLLCSGAEKLRSLKLKITVFNSIESSTLSNGSKEVLSHLTSLAISFYGIHCVEILKFCTTVTSLKLCNTHRSSEVFGSDYFKLLKGMDSLKQLTLVNFDLADVKSAEDVLPEVTTLNLISYLPILKNFRKKGGKVGRNAVNGVDVSLFVRVIGVQFPKLQSLNMMGQVFDHLNVEQQLVRQMATEQQKTLQLHFNRISS